MRLKIKQIIATLLLSLTLVVSSPLYAFAQAPSAPSAPEAPQASSAPEASTAPEAESAPEASPVPNADPSPSPLPSTDPSPDPSPGPDPSASSSSTTEAGNQDTNGSSAENSNNGSGSDNISTSTDSNQASVDSQNSAVVTNDADLEAVTGQNDASFNTKSTSSITTGDATLGAVITTDVNTTTIVGSASCCPDSVSATNSANGENSTNTANAASTANTTADFNNDGTIKTEIKALSLTGDNKTSYNTGGDSEIITGDANVVATIITDANAVNMGIYQFDVNGDQNGDIVLTADPANCINCGQNTSAENSNNGSDSQNTATASSTNTTTETIANDADVVNNIKITADSGGNDASFNTNGDSTIKTGNANVVANVVNVLNTVVDGVIHTVNIFGDLVGNILLPEQQPISSADCGCCAPDLSAENSNNGSGSTNTADATSTNTSTTTQTNNATINNNLNLKGNTGDNDVNFNTNGNNLVESGDVSVDANVINVANVNVAGGPCGDPVYMVFVNDPSGNWQGQIAGAAPGTYFYASDGLLYVVDESGNLIAVNSGNGSNSTNASTSSASTTTTTTITNNGSITNNINIEANTGDNKASYNTGGQNSITTGNANIVVNVINFINSNFSGRKVVMTVVNVLGSWIGHFVPPGFLPPAPLAQASAGGAAGGQNNSSSNDASGASSGTNGSSSSASQNGSGAQNQLASSIFSRFPPGLVSAFRTEKIIQEDNSIALAPAANSQNSPEESSAFSLKIFLLATGAILLILAIRKLLVRARS